MPRAEPLAMFCSSCNFDLRGLTSPTCPECGRAFNPADAATWLDQPRSQFERHIPRILKTIGVLAILGIITVAYSISSAARAGIRAEERLQATRVVCELIADHVEQSPTHAWPTAWADLEKLPHRGCMFKWPLQAAEYKAIVSIKFNLTTTQVLAQTPATCTAVTVSPGPNFEGSPQAELIPMFDRLRAAAASSPPPSTPPSPPPAAQPASP